MIQLDDKGLVPAIAQNADTGEVIVLGYMSPGALKRTLESGDVWFSARFLGVPYLFAMEEKEPEPPPPSN